MALFSFAKFELPYIAPAVDAFIKCLILFALHAFSIFKVPKMFKLIDFSGSKFDSNTPV